MKVGEEILTIRVIKHKRGKKTKQNFHSKHKTLIVCKP